MKKDFSFQIWRIRGVEMPAGDPTNTPLLGDPVAGLCVCPKRGFVGLMLMGCTDQSQQPASVVLVWGGRGCLFAAQCVQEQRGKSRLWRGCWNTGGAGRKTSGSARGARRRRAGEGVRWLVANSLVKKPERAEFRVCHGLHFLFWRGKRFHQLTEPRR